MKIVDIKGIAEYLKTRKDVLLVVDNTFMSAYFQNPVVLGADIAMHSLTKYMNGFSDVLMGAMATNNETIYEKLKDNQKSIGNLPSPMDCFLVLRGLKTLHLRMLKHAENALQIAEFLERHPKVEKVFYPGLASHPQSELSRRQSKGSGGMVSFCIKGGTSEAMAFVQALKVFTLAVSLGSAESLVEIPSLMTA
ncbi:Cystathionine gamma-lyase, partial [Stegodyphus mimosarum]